MKTRILIQDPDGSKGSTTAYVMWFTNAINQRRQIAHDGVKWFAQATKRSPFKQVGESEVPQHVQKEMKHLMQLSPFMKQPNTKEN